MPQIPLLDASLCLDCDLIFDATKHPNCPVCATDKRFHLSRWLNRPCPCSSETAATLQQLGNYCQTCERRPS